MGYRTSKSLSKLGRTDPPAGQLVSRGIHSLSVKDQNPFSLSCLRPYNGSNGTSKKVRKGGKNQQRAH